MRCQESQVSLAVVVHRTFTSESVDFRACLFINHLTSFPGSPLAMPCPNNKNKKQPCFLFLLLGHTFAVGLDHEIILIAKFSRSTVLPDLAVTLCHPTRGYVPQKYINTLMIRVLLTTVQLPAWYHCHGYQRGPWSPLIPVVDHCMWLCEGVERGECESDG